MNAFVGTQTIIHDQPTMPYIVHTNADDDWQHKQKMSFSAEVG